VPASPQDDTFLRVLETLPRESPPQIPIEGLLRKLAWRRARLAALTVLAVAGPVLALLLLRAEPDPPVNLNLKVVEIGEPIDLPSGSPPELNLP
jgi:hypothetical protein